MQSPVTKAKLVFGYEDSFLGDGFLSLFLTTNNFGEAWMLTGLPSRAICAVLLLGAVVQTASPAKTSRPLARHPRQPLRQRGLRRPEDSFSLLGRQVAQ